MIDGEVMAWRSHFVRTHKHHLPRSQGRQQYFTQVGKRPTGAGLVPVLYKERLGVYGIRVNQTWLRIKPLRGNCRDQTNLAFSTLRRTVNSMGSFS